MTTDSIPDDDQMSEAWRAFIGATRRLRTRTAVEGLSVSQMLLLTPLLDSEGESVGKLAANADIASPTATRMLDGLERDGYVLRQVSSDDRRRVLISLTASGRALLEADHAKIDAGRARLFGALTDDERRQAHAMLMKMSDLIEKL